MKIADIADPQRIKREPDRTLVVLSDGNFVEHGITIRKIELRLFVERVDAKLGPYSLITALVQTDNGDIESVYDEGYRGENALERTAAFLLNHLGLSAIILRSIITLSEEMEKNKPDR